MRSRGPDDEGYILFNSDVGDVCYGADTPEICISKLKNKHSQQVKDVRVCGNNLYKIGLGHRRLSIQDLSEKGHQPMSDEHERYWIVYNGEVYNFKEIRHELEQLGMSFQSETDTEVILKSYICWGNKCLEKFNGMFAFVIYDKWDNLFFIARDRLGLKPLYYYNNNGTFVFGSDIKSILATRIVQSEVDYDSLYYNFAFRITPRPNTVFKNIYSVEQGTYIRFSLDDFQMKVEKYWDFPTGVQDHSLSEGEALELLESEIFKSLSYQLISDVEVGAFMSGGVDSTTIAAMASKLHPGIKAFTLGYDKTLSEYDETKEAIATASFNNMEHIVSNLKAQDVIGNIQAIVRGYEEPSCSLAANYAISKVVSDNGIKVVMNGLGGDELFAGYSHYKNLPYWAAASKFSLIARLLPEGKSRYFDRARHYSKLEDVYQYYTSFYMVFKDDELQSLFGENKCAAQRLKFLYSERDREFEDDIELMSFLDFKHYIGNHHVHRIDQFTMAHGVEGRFPYLDHNLIEASARIPTRFKINRCGQKKILKKIASKYIHSDCIAMKKKGFSLPMKHWYSNELNDLAVSSIDDLKKRGFLNPTEVDACIARGQVSQVWQLVMTELWMKEFIDL